MGYCKNRWLNLNEFFCTRFDTHGRLGYSPSLQAVNTQVQDIILESIVLLHLLMHNSHFLPGSVNLKITDIFLQTRARKKHAFILYIWWPSADTLVPLFTLKLKSRAATQQRINIPSQLKSNSYSNHRLVLSAKPVHICFVGVLQQQRVQALEVRSVDKF